MKYFVASKLIFIILAAVGMAIAFAGEWNVKTGFLLVFSLIILLRAKDVILLFIDLFIGKKAEKLFYMGGQSEKYYIAKTGVKASYVFEDKSLCRWKFRSKNGEERVLLFPADVPVNQNEGHPINNSWAKVTYYRLSKVVYKWEQL